MSMMCRPMWPLVLMYGSHDMRHIGFLQVEGGQRDPREMGRQQDHTIESHFPCMKIGQNLLCTGSSTKNTTCAIT